ncbi:LysR family transcriptional regulator [Clostridioides sp. ZZV15-6598]|uniref:LysR family transcriptional regulator n=1 Tax=Clostridioides sp. ZZV15-6598 TaxID=2811501 RepID=UPI001D1292E9|nr:LysR family transcriptional regulator [Clostridioides sp. ZZV15-6598]
MYLKYLQTFKTIVEEGSFSKAADRLNYTQSTITFQVQQLEQELSVHLFEKIGRRMVLTKVGENLIPYVNEVLSSFDKMKNFGTDLSELRGDLHIAIAETLLCYKIPAILKQFHELAPNARLFLRSMNCYDIRDSLLSGSIDLGLFYQDIGGIGNSIYTYPVGEYSLTLVSSPKIKNQFPDFITPNQQLKIPFIIDENNCIFRQIFETYLREKDITLDHTIELWSIPTIKNLVKNDMGISYLPTFTIESEIKLGDLCEIKTDLNSKTITAVCAHHKNKWISPLMQLFIDLVTANEK